DHPEVKGDTQLAWSVDRVFVSGDYLLEVSGSTGYWGYQSPPVIRVAPFHQHDQIVNQVTLKDLSVVGASLHDGRLYVAQSGATWYPVPLDGPDPVGDSTTNPPNFFVTMFDLSHLPNLSILGQTSVATDMPGWGASWN